MMNDPEMLVWLVNLFKSSGEESLVAIDCDWSLYCSYAV